MQDFFSSLKYHNLLIHILTMTMLSSLTTPAAVIIILGALVAIIRHYDVRLVLFTAGLLLASLAGNPLLIFSTFESKMGDGAVIAPICTAMGYAFLLRTIGADKHMVRLLIAPIRSIRFLLVPGGCLIGFFTNMAITSQTASAAAVGPILIPIMIAARWHPIIAGATLVLGCSAGGNLFNPGEPDIVAIHKASGVDIPTIINTALMPEVLGFFIAVAVFTVLAYVSTPKHNADMTELPHEDNQGERINIAKALLPPLPILLLILTQPSFGLWHDILTIYPKGMPVAHAMLFSAILAILITHRDNNHKVEQFFEGIGYGFIHVIALIITATCFINGLEAVGLVHTLVQSVKDFDAMAKIISGVVPYCFAIISGSGTAPSVAFTNAVVPSLAAVNPAQAVDIGILGAIGATFGRTMSPVAAVIIFSAGLCHVKPLHIAERTAPALLCGFLGVLLFMMFR